MAVGDVLGLGYAQVITGAGPHLKVFEFNGGTPVEVRSFYAYDPPFRGGLSVATGDFDGDGRSDIIAGAGAGGTPHVAVFDGRTLDSLASFYAFDSIFHGGVSVAAGDLDADGRAEVIVGAGAGGGSHVRVFAGSTLAPMASFFAFDFGFSDGVNVEYHRRGDGHPLLSVAPATGSGAIRAFAAPGFDRTEDFGPVFLGGVDVG